MLAITSIQPGQDAVHHQEKPAPERLPAAFPDVHPTGNLIAAGVFPVEYVRYSEAATGHHTSVAKAFPPAPSVDAHHVSANFHPLRHTTTLVALKKGAHQTTGGGFSRNAAEHPDASAAIARDYRYPIHNDEQ